MDRVAVLIPCYNEALTIEKVVRDFLAVIPENSHVYTILYRADGWENPRVFYPSPETGQTIDEEALLRYLHRKKCVRRLFSSDGIPTDAVTLWITTGDGLILLGDLNEVRVQNGRSKYSVLHGEAVLKDVLEILGIDETADLSGLQPIY